MAGIIPLLFEHLSRYTLLFISIQCFLGYLYKGLLMLALLGITLLLYLPSLFRHLCQGALKKGGTFWISFAFSWLGVNIQSRRMNMLWL